MNIDIEKLETILKKDKAKGEPGISFGVFDVGNKPAIGALFCLPEHFEAVEKFCTEVLKAPYTK